ncbi:uncharacterized protein LOC119666483 [Teleopsis dalmanni]|uniref:uncharacterized protein LOC119666483 n=1 Tax=Teleopsis dalmanni TaxID=139649 RepID=UPI0018CD5A24|nr:uncharacterized protein LOC119666483 [Teleopsis dalmanni]
MTGVYDPLGFLGPFTVQIKTLLQRIWKENLDWDSTLPESLADDFNKWCDDLHNLKYFTISRCLVRSNLSTIQLHVFADASPIAYGAVAYLREILSIGKLFTSFICSKNRVSPIKNKNKSELTLPKLELTAALIAAKLANVLKLELNINFSSINMWTDSSIALQWITGDGKQVKQNISSKVSEINKLTNVYDWRHCDGKCNPADLLTRGIKAKQLMQSELRKWGPSWLIMESNEWNISKIEDSATLITKVLQEENVCNISKETKFDIQKFSNLRKMLRVTAYVFRFLRNIKNKGIQQSINTELEKIDDLTLEELNKAEVYWIGCAQSEYFLSEIISLKKGQKIGAESKILQLNPVLIDGLLRLSCRLPTTEYENLSNPIILPKKSYLSKLIVLEAHQKFMHSGINATLAKIRKRFWVVKGRQHIKSVVQRCIICKRLHGKNASENWTDLPIERVTVSKPFETTGIDFAGPLYITSTDNKNDFKKAYIMLFTCAATRGIHLELVADLTVESCINALRKFIARRGTPSINISDNAKTFKRSCMEVQKLEQLMEKTTRSKIFV